MTPRHAKRGRPLVALGLILGIWAGSRFALWDVAAFAPLPAMLPSARPPVADAKPPFVQGNPSEAVLPEIPAPSVTANLSWPSSAPSARFAAPPSKRMAIATALFESPARPSGFAPAVFLSVVGPVGQAATHHLLLAGLQRIGGAPPFYPAGREGEHRRRWTGDGWLMLRAGGPGSLAAGGVPASYGASQAGAVLRYRLAPESRHRPAAYLRATVALDGSGEREVAMGASARPFPEVPVIAAAELRASAAGGEARPRPAAMVVTELAPFDLPRGFRGEAYAQAGYVGGRFATAFADGQLRVDRKVAAIGPALLRAGAGVWGGAQKGASRLDIGPAATVAMGLNETSSARVAVDWRFRVGGNAAPSSGPALTLSAGF